MRDLIAIAAAACAASCSQQPHSNPAEGAETLPAKFMLKCQAPSGSEIPLGAEKGFDIAIDRRMNQYRLPWDESPRPIKKFTTSEIVLADDHVDVGADNNPEDHKITFSFQSGTLHYEEFYSAIVPVIRMFSSRCKIAKNA